MAGLRQKYHVDMCNGPLFTKIVKFVIPIILSLVLQNCFTAADLIVVGQYCPHEHLAAVGATFNFTNLLLNLFMGISIGVNALVSNSIGARETRSVYRAVHTSMALALAGGISLLVIGLIVTRPALELLQTPANVMGPALRYMYIYCFSIPFILLYNFSSAILRATGNTLQPMIFLVIGGIVNVILNIVFVTVFDMGVSGISAATVFSQALAAFLVLRVQMRVQGPERLHWRNVKFYGNTLKRTLFLGVPCGMEYAFYSISNMILQTFINGFGSHTIAGNIAAVNIEVIIGAVNAAFSQATLTFIAQNVGAQKWDRVKKTLWYCLGLCLLVITTLTTLANVFAAELLSIFSREPDVIAAGIVRIRVLLLTYGTYVVLENTSGALRGFGKTYLASGSVFLGTCVFRIAWFFLAFPLHPTLYFLMLCFPISWIISDSLNIVFLCKTWRKSYTGACVQSEK